MIFEGFYHHWFVIWDWMEGLGSKELEVLGGGR